jgi:serine/threonine-protein phosphatase CPPED1
LPGNHDVGNDPTPESIAAYTAKFGPDHYSFRQGDLIGVVLNSNLISSPKGAPKQALEQQDWLKIELEKAQQQQARHVVIFQHHSWFLQNVDEPDQYFNLPQAQRKLYVDLLQQHHVTHVFAGHYHGNQIARDGSLEMVTTGPIGKPLRNEQSGLRIVIVRDSGIEHRYYAMGEVPNQIDLSPPKKTAGKASDH